MFSVGTLYKVLGTCDIFYCASENVLLYTAHGPWIQIKIQFSILLIFFQELQWIELLFCIF